jgi:hypothetical protein
VRKTGINFQNSVLNDFRREQRRVGNGHDLIVVSVHDQRRDVEFFKFFCQISL